MHCQGGSLINMVRLLSSYAGYQHSTWSWPPYHQGTASRTR